MCFGSNSNNSKDTLQAALPKPVVYQSRFLEDLPEAHEAAQARRLQDVTIRRVSKDKLSRNRVQLSAGFMNSAFQEWC